jgi:hypothetical protein
MRTTLAIDEDVLAAAKHLAARDGRTLGEVITALARRGLAPAAREARGPAEPSPKGLPQTRRRNGIPLLPAARATVTPELVNALRDELP